MITVDLVNPLFYHIRQKERSIGIDFDSEQVKALYGLLEDLTIEETAKNNLKVELVLQLEEIQESIQAKKEKGAELDSVMQIAKSSELAIAMMDILNG